MYRAFDGLQPRGDMSRCRHCVTDADVARLAAHHEAGGDEREELLKNADTLSFFQVCLPLYYDRHGADITRKRLVWGFRKLPPELRCTVLDMEYPDPRLRDLVRDSVGL